MAHQILLKQGEQKTVEFTILNQRTKVAIDLTNCGLFLGVKWSKSDAAYLFSKATADFDVSTAALGKISVLFTEEDTNQAPGQLVGELKIAYPNSTIEKSDDLAIIIEQSVTPGPVSLDAAGYLILTGSGDLN